MNTQNIMKEYQGKRVLVTGGAGFIGSHLVETLLQAGAEVHVADNLSRGTLQNLTPFLNKIKFHNIDLTQFENCLSVTKDIDYIFHLAATVGGIPYISRKHVRCLVPDILMHTYILEAARINDVQKLLFASSACVYREKTKELNVFKEEDAYPANPATTYGWAKIYGEILCQSYYKDYGIKSAIVRIFNAYGERENLDPKTAHVIPSLIRKAILYPKERFVILGDGKQERAFLYVKDCVEGMMLALQKIENADPINLGSEEVVTINQLAKKIIQISGKPIKIEYDPSGTKGTYRYCPDTTKMKKLLNWTPKTPLDQGLKRTYKWAEKKLLQGR